MKKTLILLRKENNHRLIIYNAQITNLPKLNAMYLHSCYIFENGRINLFSIQEPAVHLRSHRRKTKYPYT